MGSTTTLGSARVLGATLVSLAAVAIMFPGSSALAREIGRAHV